MNGYIKSPEMFLACKCLVNATFYFHFAVIERKFNELKGCKAIWLSNNGEKEHLTQVTDSHFRGFYILHDYVIAVYCLD